ncbi:MAG: hypothetical protein OEV64_00455 [Desulfobulbaceae bacterium]|nr:hypothetical protein [Desulfobulbaceae bacterium]
MNSRTKLNIVALVFVGLVSFFSSLAFAAAEPAQEAKHSVAAVFPVTVDAFLRFQEEATKVLSERNVDVYYYSAEGDSSRFQTVINAALLKKPDVLVLVGTQLTNTGLSPRYEKSLPRVISSCISDPMKVEQLVEIGLNPPRKKPVAILTDMPRQDAYSFGAEIIGQVLPGVKKAGILYNEAEINSKNTATKMIEALNARGVDVVQGIVSGEEDVEKVARNLILQGAKLLIIPHDKYVIKKAATVVKIGLDAPGSPVPVFSLDDGTVRKDGAAFGVSVDYGYLGQLTAEVSLKIIDGDVPGNMPIIQQETAAAYFNMTSWKQLGLLPIPDNIKSNAVLY